MKVLFIGLIVGILIIHSSLVFASKSTFTMDTTLSDTSLEHYYKTPKGIISNSSFGNGSKICPSNNCRIVIDNNIGITLQLQLPDAIMISNSFRLQDNSSNGHLTPGKRALVENVDMFSICHFSDVKEGLVKGTTEYICGNNDSILFTRALNDTQYFYDPIVMKFELPSKHLVIEAQEK